MLETILKYTAFIIKSQTVGLFLPRNVPAVVNTDGSAVRLSLEGDAMNGESYRARQRERDGERDRRDRERMAGQRETDDTDRSAREIK